MLWRDSMRCPKCGGMVHPNEPCQDCGIDYDDMIAGISHPEMKKLFKRIEKLESEGESIEIESSLMACELENSSLILPAKIDDESWGFVVLPGPNERDYIALCTDKEEYDKCFSELTPLTNSWKRQLRLLDIGADGFVINPLGEACFLEREFLERFFPGDE